MSKLKPSEYQKAIFDFVKNGKGSCIIEAVAGSGKCLGAGTLVMKYDGTIVPVEMVAVGDKLMGPDSRPRKVLSTNVGHGPLYRIDPIKGQSWVCNDVHVMTLAGTNRKSGQIVDMPLNNLITETKHQSRIDRDWKLFRVPVEFRSKKSPFTFEPYLIGAWLGDGSFSGPIIHTPDEEIHRELKSCAKVSGLAAKVTYPKNNRCPYVAITHRNWSGKKNALRDFLKKHCIVGAEKRIPAAYLTGTRSDRLLLLAGLIDTDGHYCNGIYEIITKYAGLRDDILFLARSLGLAAYSKPKIGEIKSIRFRGEYHRITISGKLDSIPCVVRRKKAKPRRQIKDVLKVGFSATPIGDGEYFGFTLDGDGRFLLGDFTVTHNTTTIVGCAKRIPEDKKVLFCAFNRAIANELEKRLPSYVNVLTLNGLGHRAWARHVGGSLYLNSNKTYDILKSKSFEKQFGEWNVRKLRSKVRRLVAIAKASGIVPEGCDEEATGLLEDDMEEWDGIIEHFDLEFTDRGRAGQSYKEMKENEEEAKKLAIEMARECLRISIDMWSEIDFDDQLYLPVIFNVNFFQNDFVFVDEAQDVSTIQRVLIRRALKPKGRLIAVGDPHQAIYGFRGADSDSLESIEEEFNCERLPLSISYRCPKAVVREAQQFVSHIQSHEDAPEGVVEDMGTFNPDSMSEFQPNDFVVCRNVAPLIRLAFSLIRNKRPAIVVGRDIGASLVSLIQKLSPINLKDLSDKLEEWKEAEIRKMLERDPDANIQRIEERAECIQIFMTHSGATNISTLVSAIENLFGEDGDRQRAVRLSTIHKAKGLEAERVIMLDSWLIPSKYARKDWQQVQENNLSYVAVTRSKSFLGYVRSPAKDEM